MIVDGRLALIDRVRPGSSPYSVVPGGGVEEGESFEDAAVREAKEELGLDVKLRSSEPVFVVPQAESEQRYFLADAIGGTFGSGTGPEWEPGRGRGTYTPVLVSPDEATARSINPLAVEEAVLRSFVTGDWPSAALDLPDPRDTPPVRVRAGAVVIDDQDRVLLHRAEWDRGPFYEIPGGGVEAGETPEDAVLRELEEETGIVGEIVRPIALIWKDGRREHYFLLRPVGRSRRDVLDVEEFFVPEWVSVAELTDLPVWPKRLGWRIAQWHASGQWPDPPVELIDTILDLAPPCRW